MTTDTNLLLTPLADVHKAMGARMVPFAGWLMPVQYGGVLEETRAVREHVGVFDISHMGRFRVRGEGALELLQYATTNDVSALRDGMAQYTLLLGDDGGILDDLIVYRLSSTEFLAVVNASNASRDFDLLSRRLGARTELRDETLDTAMLAIQGPTVVQLVSALADHDCARIPRFGFSASELAGTKGTTCRTGYTGEDGFEIIVCRDAAEHVWQAVLELGAVPCGLGARDTLRVEAGYPLYGHEIHEGTTPVEAGLMWAVKLDKGDFRGKRAVLEAKRNGAKRRLMGLIMAGRAMPRQGYPVLHGSARAGEVTSGAFSVTREVAVGMAYVATGSADPGSQVQVQIREHLHPATIVRKNEILQRSSLK